MFRALKRILAKLFRANRLSLNELLILSTLSFDGELTASALAKAAKLNPNSIYFVLWDMERDGLVEQRIEEDSTGDRLGMQRFYYRITPKGLKALEGDRNG